MQINNNSNQENKKENIYQDLSQKDKTQEYIDQKKAGGIFSKSSDKSVFSDILMYIRKGFVYIFKTGLISIFILIFLDQLTKHLAQYFLKQEGNEFVVIPNFFSFTLVYNTGAAFGSLAGNKIFLVGSSLTMGIAMIVLMAIFFRKMPVISRSAAYMAIAGCFGNLIDRAFYTDGVIDFIQFKRFFGFKNFPVFNIADMCLVVGIGLFGIGNILLLIVEKVSNDKQIKRLALEGEKNNFYTVTYLKNNSYCVLNYSTDIDKDLVQEIEKKEIGELVDSNIEIKKTDFSKLRKSLNGDK